MRLVWLLLLTAILNFQSYAQSSTISILSRRVASVPVSSDITFVSVDSLDGSTTNRADPLTDTMYVGSGTNTYSLLAIRAEIFGNNAIDSITVDSANGGGLTKLDSLIGRLGASSGGLWIWGTKSITPGNRIFKLYAGSNWSGVSLGLLTFENVDQNSPVAAVADTGGTSSGPGDKTCDITSTSTQMLVTFGGSNLTHQTIVAPASTTVKLFDVEDVPGGQGYMLHGGYFFGTATATTWNLNAVDYARVAAVVLK